MFHFSLQGPVCKRSPDSTLQRACFFWGATRSIRDRSTPREHLDSMSQTTAPWTHIFPLFVQYGHIWSILCSWISPDEIGTT